MGGKSKFLFYTERTFSTFCYKGKPGNPKMVLLPKAMKLRSSTNSIKLNIIKKLKIKVASPCNYPDD